MTYIRKILLSFLLIMLFCPATKAAEAASGGIEERGEYAGSKKLSPLLYPKRLGEEERALDRSIRLTESEPPERETGEGISIDLRTPDDLYTPLSPGLSQPVRMQVFLNAFRLDLLPGIATKLKDIAEKTTFKELRVLQCSSIKFNRLFPTIRELFADNKIHQLIYTADAAGVQTPAAARRGAAELLRSPTARRAAVPSGTPGREGFMIEAELEEAKDIEDFLYKTEIKLEQEEDTRFFREYEREIEGFGLTTTRAFVRLPDDVTSIHRQFEALSEPDKESIRAISFADSSLDDSILEKIAEGLLSLPNLGILDLSSIPITKDSFSTLKRILEKVSFVNITMTELIEDLFEEEGFAQYLEEDVDQIKKLIWLPLEERDLTPQIEELEGKYREVVREAHQVFGKISRVLDHLEERQEAQKMTLKNLG